MKLDFSSPRYSKLIRYPTIIENILVASLDSSRTLVMQVYCTSTSSPLQGLSRQLKEPLILVGITRVISFPGSCRYK